MNCFEYNENEPMWWSKSNFISLLNLPDQINFFGPLRFYWDGSRERFIQSVKPWLQHMRQSDSYLVCKLESIHKDIALNYLMTNEERQKVKYTRFLNVRIYKDFLSLQGKFESNEPISVGLRNDNSQDCQVFCCFRKSIKDGP